VLLREQVLQVPVLLQQFFLLLSSPTRRPNTLRPKPKGQLHQLKILPSPYILLSRLN
jgi:hypothetical protein